MAERFIDYFQEFRELGLDRWAKTREKNLGILNQQYKRVRNQHSEDARLEHALLSKAKKIFENEQRYQEYLRQWDAEAKAHESNQADIDEAHQRAEEARKKAQEAEAARQREAQKRKELEKKLEEERRRAEKAKRQAQLQREQEPPADDGRPGFWDTLLKGVAEVGAELLKERLTAKDRETSGQPTRAYTPDPINLSGDWRSADGILHRIWQRGNQIKIQAINPLGVVIMDGAGTFDGYNIHVSYTALLPTVLGPRPTSGEAQAEVSSNGQNIRGRATNFTTGQINNINLYR